jgi:HEAT repeat protein
MKLVSRIRIGFGLSTLQHFIVVWVLCWLAAPSWASCPDMEKLFTGILERRGYSVQSFEGLCSVMDSQSFYDRKVAIQLLGLCYPQQSIPVFKTRLSDPHITVRIMAAHYLGVQGDKTGLDQMQEDLSRLLGSRQSMNDPNRPPRRPLAWEFLKGQELGWSLDVANVLAELGDNQGFELAKECLLKSPLAACRSRAVKVLAQINLNRDKLKVPDKNDPIPIISQAAEKEENWLVYTDILRESKRLKPEVYRQVLQRAVTNTKQADREIGFAKSRLSSR